ncbi:MAG TPA: hypothetical protein VMH02_12755 [Verrucomicrobiae bacterium]|nr:hypothetical protein [Verrucomicrobiae bacterium]
MAVRPWIVALSLALASCSGAGAPSSWAPPLAVASGASAAARSCYTHAERALVIVASAASFPGSSCTVGALHGGRYTLFPITASPKNGTLTLSAPAKEIDKLASGAAFAAIICS